MKIFPARSARAIAALARAMKARPIDAARGVIRVVNANMERAIRVITVERGFDPREFALLAFGGAGPMHACELAMDLGIRRVILPRNPGLLCAWGALGAPLGREYSLTVRESSPDYRGLLRRAAPMIHRAERELAAEGIARRQVKHELFVDMRYRGQSYELEVALTARFAADFHRAHQRTFGHSAPGAAIEAVNLRLRASAPGPRIAPHRIAHGRKAPAPLSRIDTLVGSGVKRVPVYSREAIGAGVTMNGPLVVVELSSTAYVAPEFAMRADAFGNLHLERR